MGSYYITYPNWKIVHSHWVVGNRKILNFQDVNGDVCDARCTNQLHAEWNWVNKPVASEFLRIYISNLRCLHCFAVHLIHRMNNRNGFDVCLCPNTNWNMSACAICSAQRANRKMKKEITNSNNTDSNLLFNTVHSIES